MRAAGLQAIDPAVNLIDRFTLNDYVQTIDQLRLKLDAHNSALAAINSSQTEITALEKTLNEITERMLIGVAFKFGKDSREYEMADGVRKSERVRTGAIPASKQALRVNSIALTRSEFGYRSTILETIRSDRFSSNNSFTAMPQITFRTYALKRNFVVLSVV